MEFSIRCMHPKFANLTSVRIGVLLYTKLKPNFSQKCLRTENVRT